ncbi:MAG: hypothetical protein IKE43_10590 [Coriobacteriales bacterium]|nr:hypothetical protein [Coriobacteriales bacterium]
MKRDIDLVRFILIETEKADIPLELDRFVTDEWPLPLVGYHVELMIVHNLIDATVTKDWNDVVIRGKLLPARAGMIPLHQYR